MAMAIKKLHASDSELAEITRNSLFITSASYEERCLTVPKAVADIPKKAIVFWVKNLFPQIEVNLGEIEKCIGSEKVRKVATDISDPVASASEIDQAIMMGLEGEDGADVVIDITTFTHEHLLFLIKSLALRKEKIKSLKCIYSGAAEYSYNEKDTSKWLSKGCAEVRSVVGYPGTIYPGVETVLIIVFGFEHERAECVREEMQPDSLYLGVGSSDSVTDDAHRAPLALFSWMFEDSLAMQQDVHKFSFEACNPEDAFSKLEEIIEKTPGCNHIIVPMNTKLSTLAVAAIGLRNPEVQLCYAQPETYNFEAYSKPGDVVHVFDGTQFLLGDFSSHGN